MDTILVTKAARDDVSECPDFNQQRVRLLARAVVGVTLATSTTGTLLTLREDRVGINGFVAGSTVT